MTLNFLRRAFITSSLILTLNSAIASKITLSSECEPITDLNINGVTIKRLLIDTGASGGLHLNENVIQNLPGTRVTFLKTEKYADAYGKTRQTNVYLAPELVVEGIRLQQVPLIAFKRWGHSEERQKIFPTNGLIGLDTFGDKAFHIDLQKMRFSISDNFIPEPTASWKRFPIKRTRYGAEIVAIGERGKQLRLVLDTGANKSVIFYKNSDATSSKITEVIVGKDQVIPLLKIVMDPPGLADIDGFIGCDFFKNKHAVITKDNFYINSIN